MELVPPPDIVNKKKEYEVEEIRKHRKWGWKTQFLVHWKSYEDEHDQWIVETGLPHVKKVIEDYGQEFQVKIY